MDFEAQARDYLTGKHCVLWPSVIFDLTDAKEQQAAIEWLAQLMEDLS